MCVCARLAPGFGSRGGAQPQAGRARGWPPPARRARGAGAERPGTRSGDSGRHVPPGPSRRWPLGPGRGQGRTGRREGLISRNKVAGLVGGGAWEETGSGSGGGGRRTGPARPPPAPPRETAPRGARLRAGSQGGATERSRAPPFLLSLQRSAPTKGQACGRGAGGGGGGGAGRASRSPEVGESPGLGGGERAAAACRRGRSPAAGEEEPGAPEADWGLTRSGAPPCFGVISADGKLSGVWQTWCLRARSRFAPGLFCFFGGTAGQEDCTSQGQFESDVRNSLFPFGPRLGLFLLF